MTFADISYSKYRGPVLVLLAVIGGALGFAVSAPRARATTCRIALPWDVTIGSTTSSDPSVDHRPLWPDRLSLSAPPLPGVSDEEVSLVRKDGSGRYVEAKR
jgi:hypothetical protein